MDHDTIIALDLGKFKTVACVMDTATRQHRFDTIAMSPANLHQLLVDHATPSPGRTLVVFETCDTAGWVRDVCSALGVGTLCTHGNGEAWQWRRVKRKTDRDDAGSPAMHRRGSLKLAGLALMDQLPAVHIPSPDQRQKRRMILHRRSVVSRRTKSRNAIRSIFNQQGLSLARGNKQWTRAGIEELKQHAKPIGRCQVIDLWRGRLHVELELIEATDQQLKQVDAKLDELSAQDPRVKLLQTIKGVGPRTAEAVVLHLDDPHRFGSAEEVANYAGLVPRQLESGQMSRYGHITRRGPNLLRSMLVEGGPGDEWPGPRVGGVEAQRLGPGLGAEDQPRQPQPSQAGDRGVGPQAAGDLLVDAEAQPSVPQPRKRHAPRICGGGDNLTRSALPFRRVRKCLLTATNQVHGVDVERPEVRCSECGAGLVWVNEAPSATRAAGDDHRIVG